MSLLPTEVKQILPPLRSTAAVCLEDKRVICRFFLPDDCRSWLVLEGEPKVNSDDFIFFGAVIESGALKLDIFRLSELLQIRGVLDMPVEFDKRTIQKPLRYLVSPIWCKGGAR